MFFLGENVRSVVVNRAFNLSIFYSLVWKRFAMSFWKWAHFVEEGFRFMLKQLVFNCHQTPNWVSRRTKIFHFLLKKVYNSCIRHFFLHFDLLMAMPMYIHCYTNCIYYMLVWGLQAHGSLYIIRYELALWHFNQRYVNYAVMIGGSQ